MKVPYFVPWISDEDRKNVQKALGGRWLTNGPYLRRFESKIARHIGVQHASGVGSATHALHLSLRALGISNGDEVIVPTHTFAATANAVIYCGARPVFADVDMDTCNILPDSIKRCITKRTKAIIPVHYGGQSCDMDNIQELAKQNGLYIIEDCAHALGASFEKKKCGSMGDLGCFSFYPTKIMTTGEGGMVVTSDAKLQEKVNLLRSQGMSVSARDRERSANWRYDIIDLGYNYRLDEIRAALGSSQASRIGKINKMRIAAAAKLDRLVGKIKGVTIPLKKPGRNHIYHLYSIKVEKNYPLTRDELFAKLASKGIGASVQYRPLHLMTYYKKYMRKSMPLPNAELVKDKILCLPIFPHITDKQIKYVASVLQS